MSLSFTGRLERGERVGWKRLSTYWVHVFKRILPLAVVMVVGILVASRFLLGPERWIPLVHEAVSVVFYYENWWSISTAVDYYARKASGLSPFEHFWSLSVQGQIFLAWPVLFALSGLLARILRCRVRPVLLAVFGTVFAASLAYSVWFTAADQTVAYYSTFTRLWEFAAGTLVAVLLPWIRLPRQVAAALNWVGLLAILVCGIVLDVQGIFPGWVALWPVLAASLVIVGGQTGTRWGAERILSWKPLVRLGGYSYALYLIHWPLQVFYLAATGAPKVGYVSGLGLLTLSVLGAIVLTEVVETPLRRWKWAEARRWRSLLVVAACLLIGAGTAFGWQARIEHQNAELKAAAARNNPGAAALLPGFRYQGQKDATILPTAATRSEDWAWQQVKGTRCEEDPTIAREGLEGDHCLVYNAPEHPTRDVVAVGNSHMEMWLPDLTAEAKEKHWNLIFVGAASCRFSSQQDNSFSSDCQQWEKQATAFVAHRTPDVLLMQTTESAVDRPDWIPEGAEDQAARWTRSGAKVIGLRDTPRFTEPMADCEARAGLDSCTYTSPMAGQNPTAGWKQSHPGYTTLEMNDVVCPEGTCPPAIGNVYTYLDNNHLTSTYVVSAKKQYEDRLQAALTEVGL